jgi:hypothetical protein
MINFRDTKSGDTFSEDGDGGIFYGTKSRVSTIRFEIVDTFLIDAHDITLNLNVSHHAFHDFNPFEQDEFAKGASLRLSIVQGKYSEGEVMDDLMDDLADFMHHHLGARKNRSKSSSKKKSASNATVGAAVQHRKILASDPVDVNFPSGSEQEHSEQDDIFPPQDDSNVLPSPSADVDMQYNSVSQNAQAAPQRLNLSSKSNTSDSEEADEVAPHPKPKSTSNAAKERKAKGKVVRESKEEAAKEEAAKAKAAKAKAAKAKAAKAKAAKAKAAKAKAAKAKAAKAKAAKEKAAKEKAAKEKAAEEKTAKEKAAHARKQKAAKQKEANPKTKARPKPKTARTSKAKAKKVEADEAAAEVDNRKALALAAASAALATSSDSDNASDQMSSASDVMSNEDGDDIGISDIEMEDAMSDGDDIEEPDEEEDEEEEEEDEEEEEEDEEDEQEDASQHVAGDATAKILQNLLSGENSKAALNKKIESSRRATIEKATRKLNKNMSSLKGQEQAKIAAYSDERLASESRLKKSLLENDKELEKVLRKRKAIVAEIKSTSMDFKRRRKELVSGMGEAVSHFKSQAGNIVQQAAAVHEKKEQRMRDTRRKSVQQALGVLANHL